MSSNETVSVHDDREYLYGRIRLLKRIADRFLRRDGCIFQEAHGDPTSVEAVVYAYCGSRRDALEFSRDVFALGTELAELGKDLQRFVKEYETEKWSD